VLFTGTDATNEVGEAAADVGADLYTPTPSPTGDASQEDEPMPHRRHGKP
jgi:hypothetical protein